MEPVIPFDLARMFLGDHPPLFLLEVMVRTLIMYGYTLLAVRFLGKRGTGQLTAFDFIVVILLGSAAGDPMFYDDVPILYGLVVITIVVLIERALNWWTNSNEAAESFIEGLPTLLLQSGVVNRVALEKEGISYTELMMELRQKGIRNTGEVERVYIEPSGRMSIFKAQGARYGGISTLPEDTNH